jgi:hypothetical protein
MSYKFVAFFAIILAMSLSACGDSSSSKPVAPAKPQSMTGTWQSTNPPMTAHISNGQIEINVIENDPDGLYWKGTFDTSIADGSTFVSKGDTAAMGASMMGSEDSTKSFTYQNGELSYTFGMRGKTYSVHLKR